MLIVWHRRNLSDNTKFFNIAIVIDVVHVDNCITVFYPFIFRYIKIS